MVADRRVEPSRQGGHGPKLCEGSQKRREDQKFESLRESRQPTDQAPDLIPRWSWDVYLVPWGTQG